MANHTTPADLRPVRRTYLKSALMGCTALVTLLPTGVLAQQAVGTDQSVVLDTIDVDGLGIGTDDDASSIVATQSSAGSKMPTDLLDTPASVSVITAAEIEQRGARTVEQVLEYTAGVATDFYGSDDRFDFFKIRGFDAYTYRDGLTLGRPFGAIREEVFAFERVEVLKGANSSAFGISDPGGSVNYVSKRPRFERFGQAYATGGSFNHAEAGLDFGDVLTPDGTLAYRLTGKIQDADKEYDYSRDDEQFVMGGLSWQPTAATNLTFLIDYLNRDDVPGSGGHPIGTDFDRSKFFGEPDFNYRGAERTTATLLLDHDFGNGFTFGSNARYSDTKSDFGYAYISATPTDGSTTASRAFFSNESTAEQFIIDARLQYDTTVRGIASRTLVGVEYNHLDTTNAAGFMPAPSIDWNDPVFSGPPAAMPPYSSEHSKQNGKAIYLQQDLTFADKLIAGIGLRHDWIDSTQTDRIAGVTAEGDFSEPTVRAALTYKVTDEVSTYVSYAESVVPATLTVEPEQGDQLEFGVKYRPAGMRALFSAAVYDLTKSNITRTDPITFLPVPIGEARVRGLDLEARAELPRNIGLTAAYSYMDSEIVSNGTAGNEGNQLAFVPEHLASLWVDYALEGSGRRGDMTFGLGARYQGSYYFDDANTIEADPSVVFDAAYTYEFVENTAIELNVSNLFDEKYVSYGGFGADFYNPGRQVFVTLRRTW